LKNSWARRRVATTAVVVVAALAAVGISAVASTKRVPAIRIEVEHLEQDYLQGALSMASGIESWHQQQVGEDSEVVRDPRQLDGSTGS
jgi:hypothetical protein